MTAVFLFRHGWMGVLFALGAFPILLAGSLVRGISRRSTAARLDAWILTRWLGTCILNAQLGSTAWRLKALVVSLPISAISLYLVAGIALNFGYPLRPGSEPGDWGGPTLAGRWVVHAAGGVMFAIVAPWFCGGMRNLAKRLLGVSLAPPAIVVR